MDHPENGTVWRKGVSGQLHPVDTMLEKLEDPQTYNAEPRANSLVSDGGLITSIEAKAGEAGEAAKSSQNGNGPSVWFEWTSTQIPELGADKFLMFKANDAGGARPHVVRQEWAV